MAGRRPRGPGAPEERRGRSARGLARRRHGRAQGHACELTLPPEAVEQWVGALNDVRLALGVVLEVTEDERAARPGRPACAGSRALRLVDLAPGIARRGAAGNEPRRKPESETEAGTQERTHEWRHRRRDRCRRPRATGSAALPPTARALPWADVTRVARRGSRNYWVCTTRADGRPHAMPVWGLWIDDAVWFSTDPTSIKGRNLRGPPRRRDPPRERRRGVRARGTRRAGA